MLNVPVAGSRTWMWTMAAPAFAASMAVAAICSGVIAQWGLLATLVSSPVTAQVMKTSGFKAVPLGVSIDSGSAAASRAREPPTYYNDGNNKVTVVPALVQRRSRSSAVLSCYCGG
jgi:hypothetical protein